MRVGDLEGLEWRDVDEPRDRWRVRGENNHTKRDRWITPPPDIFAAVLALAARAKIATPARWYSPASTRPCYARS